MKLLLLILLNIPIYLLAQKHDNVWLYGLYNRYATTNNIYGGAEMDFNHRPPLLSRAIKPMDFDRFCVSMCDTSGHLLFYSNGLRIANRNDQVMDNGDSIGYGNGISWNYFVNPTNGYSGSYARQAGFGLQLPGSDSLYYMFHDAVDNNGVIWLNCRNHLSVIDMSRNQGLGKVIEKDRLLMADSFEYPSACKHANGRDWWVIIPRLTHDRALRLLITPQGVTEQQVIRIGPRTPGVLGIFTTIFSPDGSKYAMQTKNGFIRIYDFDRCTGSLTFERDIAVDSLYFFSNFSFSPNSRYIYKIDGLHIVQIDLQSNPVTRDTVAIGFSPPSGPFLVFGPSQLMPDGKIYSITSGADTSIHIIHAPDSAGLACRVEPKAIISPVINNNTMPYFPNYRLGPLRGSGCDTLVSGVVTSPTPPEEGLRVYPNPTSGLVNIEVPEGLVLTELRVYDTLGRLVLRKQEGIGASLDMSVLPKNIYLLEFWDENGKVGSEKLIRQ